VRKFGSTIALWGFIAVQQSNAAFDTDLLASIQAAAMTVMCISQCPAKSYYALATREAGLVQIANALRKRLQRIRIEVAPP
jgi:hypothetical protein